MYALLGLLCLWWIPFRASAQSTDAGSIKGNIDEVSFDGASGVISGWACQQRQTQSITVRVFLEGTFLVAGKADLGSEAAVGLAPGRTREAPFSSRAPSGASCGRERSLT